MKPLSCQFINRLVKWMVKYNKTDLIIDIYPLYKWNIEINDPDDEYKNEHLFHYCCRQGKINIVKKLYENYIIDIDSKNYEAIFLSAQGGFLEQIIYLLNLTNNFTNYVKLFTQASISGNIKLIKYLTTINHDYDIEACLNICFQYDNISLAKWILDPNNTDFLAKRDFIFYDRCFCLACYNNCLSMVKYIYELGKPNTKPINDLEKVLIQKSLINIHQDIENCFKIACEINNLEMVKWIYTLDYKICFSENLLGETCFYLACINGNLTLAKWLYFKCSQDLSLDTVFRDTCVEGELETAQWLFSLGKLNNPSSDTFQCLIIDYLESNTYDFDSENAKRYFNMIIWYYETFGVKLNKSTIELFFDKLDLNLWEFFYSKGDIKLDKELFSLAIKKQKLNLVQWMYTRGDFKISDSEFRQVLYQGNLKIAKWLKNTFRFKINSDVVLELLTRKTSFSDLNFLLWLTKDHEIPTLNIKNVWYSYNINVIEWLISNGKLNIDDRDSFLKCCFKGDIQYAKLLYFNRNFSLTKENIKSLFEELCALKNLETLKWVYQLTEIKILKRFIKLACNYNNLDIAKWLLSKSKLKLDPTYLAELLDYSLQENHDEMSRWLFSLGTIQIKKSVFDKVCQNNNISLAKFLYKNGGLIPDNNTLIACLEIVSSQENIKSMFSWLLGLKPNNYNLNDNSLTDNLYLNKYYPTGLQISIWLFQKNYLKNLDFKKLFSLACEMTDLELAKWFYLKSKQVIKNEYLLLSIKSNDIEMLIWLYQHGNIRLNKEHLEYAIEHGYLDICKWIYQKSQIRLTRENIIDGFSLGNLDMSKWLYYNYSEPFIKNLCFEITCDICDNELFNDKLAILDWLHSLGIEESSLVKGFDFLLTIGEEDLALWLYKKEGDVLFTRDDCIISACIGRNLQLVEWVYSKKKCDLKTLQKCILFSCVKYESLNIFVSSDSLDVLKWLLRQPGTDIRYNDDEAFYKACETGYTECVEYLSSLIDDYEYSLDSNNSDDSDSDNFNDNFSEDYSLGNQAIIPMIKNTVKYFIVNEDWVSLKNKLNHLIETDTVFCSICYEEGNIKTPCGHEFCLKCLGSWYLKSTKCPYCNGNFKFENVVYLTKTS